MNNKKIKRKPKKLTTADLQDRLKRKFYKNPTKSFTAKQLIHLEKLSNNIDSVNHALTHISSEGYISELRPGKYQFNKNSVKDSRVFEGVVDMTKYGTAYIITEELDSDIFVPKKKVKNAMHNDRVEVMVISKLKDKYTGEILKVLERNTTHFVGTYQSGQSFGFVIPQSTSIPFDIYIHPNDNLNALDGDHVIVKIDRWPSSSRKSPIGHIERILSEDDRNEIRMQAILAEQGFSEIFPEDVEAEVANMKLDRSPKEMAKRRDMRDVPTFTIDPFDAKDFDDALSYRVLKNGNIEIGVHIADVAHYVQPNTALDKEAYKRSTSVYMVDRVAPMLPEKLSNELCSLRPNEDSFTFSAIFELDKSQGVVKQWFGKAIIHSDYRFSYETAQEVIDGETDNPYAEELIQLNNIAKILRKRRISNGSIEFESDEIKILLDEAKKPVAIKIKERLDTHLLVEEYMLLANQQTGSFMAKRDKPEVPFIYRIHDLPDEDRMQDFALMLKEMGFHFATENNNSIKDSIKKLNEVAKKDDSFKLVQPMAIRMMAKAVYSADNIGHFGLGFDYYSHFTSPIRRYSDVIAHRILFANLDKVERYDKATINMQCKHISNQEKKAMEAERDSIKYKKAEFIQQFIGETFEGIISGFIEKGIFIEIKENKCEGMITFDKLDDTYYIASNKLEAVGKNTGDVLKLGQQLTIKVVDVDIDRAEIDMDLVQEEG